MLNPTQQAITRKSTHQPLSLVILLLLAVQACAESADHGVTLNGFEITDPLVPISQILRGGPPRDGIPSIDHPQFSDARKADNLQPDDRVIGLSLHGEAKAYPIRIMNYHEIVNDNFAGHPVVVSFCPLCGTGMAFNSKIAGEGVKFGVSGLLYNSDLLMYDHATDSLWSQIEGKAIAGPLKGAHLELLPVQHTTWQAWQAQNPATKVLSEQTGHFRNYARSPYPGYESSDHVYFPVDNMDRRYHPKELVLGLNIDGNSKVYPFIELRKGPARFADTLGDTPVTIVFDDENNAVKVLNHQGQEIPSVTAFWFAWMAFHPESKVYLAK